MSIDFSAVKGLFIDKQEFYIPEISDKIILNDDIEETEDLQQAIMNSYIYTTMENEFSDVHFNEKKFQYYIDLSNELIKNIEKVSSSKLKDWILQQKNKFICYNYDSIWSSSKLLKVEKNVWKSSQYYNFNEDDRLMHSAVSNMSYLYNINVSDAYFNGNCLNCFTQESMDYIQSILSIDSSKIGQEAEEKLKHVHKKDNDEFFEDRIVRFYKVIDALKQGYYLTSFG